MIGDHTVFHSHTRLHNHSQNENRNEESPFSIKENKQGITSHNILSIHCFKKIPMAE